jgi:hypothetical protein
MVGVRAALARLPPKPPKPRISNPQEPPVKRQKMSGHPANTAPVISESLGKLVNRDLLLLKELGWERFIQQRRVKDIQVPPNWPHRARSYLQRLGKRGAPVTLSTPPWSQSQQDHALKRGPHKSAREHQEMAKMILQGQWIVLPYDEVCRLKNLCVSPIGVVPQRNRRPRTIVDYSFWGINKSR